MIPTAAAKLLPIVVAAAWLVTGDRPTRIVEPGADSCNVELKRTVWLMGTELTAVVCADERSGSLAVLEAAFSAIGEVEARLSTWMSESELSRLNSAPVGEWVVVSPATAGVLRTMRDWARRTNGAFDPAVGVLIDAWDLRGAGRVPSDGEAAEALERTGIRFLELDSKAARARRLREIRIDAGAFGKGAGLVAARQILAGRTGVRSVLLDFGGQLELIGTTGRERWDLGVADPVLRNRPVLSLRLGPASVATTGASERFIEVGGDRFGHVLDPRTGRPVSAWGSVTVVADDPLTADVLSTALFVMGLDEALAWSRDHEAGVLIQAVVDGKTTTFKNRSLITREAE